MRSRLDFPDADGGRLRLALDAPAARWIVHEPGEVAAAIDAADAAARGGSWVVGFVAYEAAAAFDAAMQLHAPCAALPLAAFAAYPAVRRDPEPVPVPAGLLTGRWQWLDAPERIHAGVEAIRAEIGRGEVYQVNYTTRLRAALRSEPVALFEALRRAQPQGYCAFLDGEGWQIASASPELFFDLSEGGVLTTRPMKGTAARDADPERDRLLAQAMAASAKERAENLMIVDLLRNDLSRVAVTGTVRVPRLFEVVALPTAWQMTSTVVARRRAGARLSEIFSAIFPCGSITGAPKIAAMASIARLESTPRGAYCGAIGCIRPGGHATFNVAIRTVAIDAARAEAEYGVGSGITFDSVPAAEYLEWQVKQRVLQRASGFEAT